MRRYTGVARRGAAALALTTSVVSLGLATACDVGADCDPARFANGSALSGADLSAEQLQQCDLSMIDLSGADLRGTNLVLADLSDTDLTGADLRGANLSYAALVRADLTGADLRGALLTGADLTDVVLRSADLGGAELTGATVDATDLTDDELGAVTSGGLIGTPAALPAGWVITSGALRVTSIPPHASTGMTDDPWYHGAGPKVVVLGDSLTNSAHDQLHGALLDHASVIVSMPGEGFAGGQGTVELGSSTPVMPLRAATFAATDPAVAVVALGTNDASNPLLVGTDPMPDAERIFGSFDGACTVGVLIAESAPWPQYDAPKAVAVNQKIRSLADVVVDWRLHAAPGDIDWDGIHLTAEGRAAFTAAVRAGIDACETTNP